jgi:hypothetical protein
MQKNLLALLLVIVSGAASGQDIVQFRISKPYSVLSFIETATGAQGTSPTLRKFIEASIPKEDTVFNNLLVDFARLSLYNNYKRGELPASRHVYRSTHDLLVIAAVESETLAAFKKRSIGILSNSGQQELFRILFAAEKYYDKIINTPYAGKMAEHLTALEKYQSKANELFAKFKDFYNSSWTNDIPFNVTLFPIPGKRGVSTATPHANSLCVGVLTDETDHSQRLGVVLHEMCHVLYDEQLSSFQYQLDNVFSNNGSPYSHLASSFFDEALATALGNGWTYQYITGKADTSSWYNNTYINGFAHALYPMTDQYLTAHKPIDADFINNAIRLFATAFPRSTTDFSILMNNMFLYTDIQQPAERQQLKSMLLTHFRASRFNFSSPILHEYSLASLEKAKETQLIIIDRDHEPVIAKLKKLFPQADAHLKNKSDRNFVLTFFDKAKRPVIIVCAENMNAVDKAFVQLAKQQYMDESRPYMKVE